LISENKRVERVSPGIVISCNAREPPPIVQKSEAILHKARGISLQWLDKPQAWRGIAYHLLSAVASA